MAVFGDYAHFYDGLYQDKDYEGECDYLEKVFAKFSRHKVKTILNLGSGTGNHDVVLAKKGYQVTGVDMSAEMLKQARAKVAGIEPAVKLVKKDITKLQLNKKFDAVVSMFAVMGYMADNGQLEKACKVAAKHLKKGGVFVFDSWFGPAVLVQKPKDKQVEVEYNNGKIHRKTKAKLDVLNQVIDVTFESSYSEVGKVIHKNKETHTMRFFFAKEIEYFLRQAGFSSVILTPFLKTTGSPTLDDWNMSIVAVK